MVSDAFRADPIQPLAGMDPEAFHQLAGLKLEVEEAAIPGGAQNLPTPDVNKNQPGKTKPPINSRKTESPGTILSSFTGRMDWSKA